MKCENVLIIIYSTLNDKRRLNQFQQNLPPGESIFPQNFPKELKNLEHTVESVRIHSCAVKKM